MGERQIEGQNEKETNKGKRMATLESGGDLILYGVFFIIQNLHGDHGSGLVRGGAE